MLTKTENTQQDLCFFENLLKVVFTPGGAENWVQQETEIATFLTLSAAVDLFHATLCQGPNPSETICSPAGLWWRYIKKHMKKGHKNL